MPTLATYQYTLNETPQAVTHVHNQGMVLTFHNAAKSSNNRVFLGGSAVGTATGLHIDSDQFLQLTISPEQQLWAVSDPAGIVLEVIEQRM
jgi:hypothetical protein